MILDIIPKIDKPVFQIGYILSYVEKVEKIDYFNDYAKCMEKLTALHSKGVFPKMESVNSESRKSQFIDQKMRSKGFEANKIIFLKDYIEERIYCIRFLAFEKIGKSNFLHSDLMILENGNFVVIQKSKKSILKITSQGLQFQFHNLKLFLKDFHDSYIPINQ